MDRRSRSDQLGSGAVAVMAGGAAVRHVTGDFARAATPGAPSWLTRLRSSKNLPERAAGYERLLRVDNMHARVGSDVRTGPDASCHCIR